MEVLSNPGASAQPVECLAALPVNPLFCNGINIIASSASSEPQSSIQSTAFVSVGGIKAASGVSQGIALAVVEPSTCAFTECQSFDTHTSVIASADLVQFIGSIQAGKIVVGGSKPTSPGQCQESFTANRQFQDLGCFRGLFVGHCW